MLYNDISLTDNRAIVPFAKDYQHGETEPDHHHRCAQLLHALSGVVIVNTDYGSWVVPPGRGVWMPAHTRHNLRFVGLVQARTLFVDPLARADLPALCQVVAVSPLLRELTLAALLLPLHFLPGGREERIMELILDEIRLLPILPLHLPEPQDLQLAKLCADIQRHLAQPWTLAQGAERLNVSERTLARRFQRETGLHFSDWVRRARLLQGLSLLAAGQSVLAVALELGYDSPSAFSAMFRRSIGVSPSEYLTQSVPVATKASEKAADAS